LELDTVSFLNTFSIEARNYVCNWNGHIGVTDGPVSLILVGPEPTQMSLAQSQSGSDYNGGGYPSSTQYDLLILIFFGSILLFVATALKQVLSRKKIKTKGTV